jgi:hypothetical protein
MVLAAGERDRTGTFWRGEACIVMDQGPVAP